MIPSWAYLDEREQSVFRATVAFLSNRLVEPRTIDWAVRLTSDRRIERIAIENLLSSRSSNIAKEPWTTAWRLIEESWSEKPVEDGPSSSIYNIQARLRAGDRTGVMISAIVDLVAPRLKVEAISPFHKSLAKAPRRPKTFRHLISAGLASNGLVDLNVLELEKIDDVPFLTGLANALESAVEHGLNIGRRLGWDGQSRVWQLGDLSRVYYVDYRRRGSDEFDDPDAHHNGIAPAVKLLYAVVARIGELSPNVELSFVRRWEQTDSLIHVRLWAAAARNSAMVSSAQLAEFLLGINDTKFWDIHVYPEIAELRATRFSELTPQAQDALISRLRKGPPRAFWPRKAAPEEVKSGRLFWALREMRRIVIAGANLPAKIKRWLDAEIGQFPDLINMPSDKGFPEGLTVRDVPPNPDGRYDALEGAARLHALESALWSGRISWNDDPAGGADDWLRQRTNVETVLGELEAAESGGNEFPKVWDRFGWSHGPESFKTAASEADLQNEADRVMALLAQLSEKTLSIAIEGISHWLERWRRHVVASDRAAAIWSRTWPIAVATTNARQASEDSADLDIADNSDDSREPLDLDTLNTPTGKLVSVFMAACPSLDDTPAPFVVGALCSQMRDVLVAADGRSGLIVRHRLIEALDYFFNADRGWTEQVLLTPLLNDDGDSLTLWRAVARRSHFTDVLKIIGGAMAERATDYRLGRETRKRIVFSLVVETLRAFHDKRASAVPNGRVQQMLRTLDDEVRSSAANVVQQYIQELSTKTTPEKKRALAAALFRTAVAPFLGEVWPQERSLATPGVSKALADLPATSKDAFAEAVDAIERFLVPFECWSMLEYGLFGDEDGVKKILQIDNSIKAEALLHMLDLTIGTSQSAVIPYDLTDALDQIRSVAPHLVTDARFRRFSTVARRI